MKRATHLTPGEFELMQIVWSLGEGSVKEIWKKVNPQRDLAYTTVMTVLDKMRRKGILNQHKRGKAYVYTPALRPDEALEGVIEHVVETYFNGSRADFLRFVSHRGSPEAASPNPSETVVEVPGRKTDEEEPIEEFLL
jgi:BlaI family transcriptional regulator, penicillinase repressor